MLGIPAALPQNQDAVFGRLVSVTPERLEIELDVPYDLRGWGGAPVVLDSSQRVIGMLQAHYSAGRDHAADRLAADFPARGARPPARGRRRARLRAVRIARVEADRTPGARRAHARRARAGPAKVLPHAEARA